MSQDDRSTQDVGVVVPAGPDGRRSSTSLGRAVAADALRAVDPIGAAAVERETNWRGGYLGHYRRLVEAGLPSRDAALTIAADGLGSVHRRMCFRSPDGDERPLADVASDAASDTEAASGTARLPGRVELTGEGTPETTLGVPFAGRTLSGDALGAQLDAWTRAGTLEPSAAEMVRAVMAHPEWLRLEGRTVVVLGAGAEMGPLPSLLRWGARVAAIDLPRPELWGRVAQAARRGAGTLVAPDAETDPVEAARGAVPGLDLVADFPAAAAWIAGLDGELVLGNYVYADGVANLRLSAAVDALTARLLAARRDVSLAFLATPTDVFAVPDDAVQFALHAYDNRSRGAKLLGRPLRTVSAGRLLRRPYAPGVLPGINDALVHQQGPNYALAKRLQRWRAAVARDAGATVSLNVAPPTRTRSVVKNRALAAAYAGAHRFAVEVFEPDTASTLMAVLLVADLNGAGAPPHGQPWQDEAHGAVHGGLWRCAYQPRSALGLAAVLGYGAARS